MQGKISSITYRLQEKRAFGSYLIIVGAIGLWLMGVSNKAIAQVMPPPIPPLEVPEEIKFADLNLKIKPYQKDKIRDFAKKLTANNRVFRASVDRADAYMHLIERVLEEEGVPTDFKYLPLQESQLQSDVVSASNAVGFWQFKAETATDYKLRIDTAMDERMHIMASTRAAARYIKKNNQYLNNWLHALLSYYAGLRGARSIVNPDEAGQKELSVDSSTHWYITKFLAHKLAYEENLNRNPLPPLKVLTYDECEDKTLAEISAETGINLDTLAMYNKWLKTSRVPRDKDYTVLLPTFSGNSLGLLVMQEKPVLGVSENLKPYEKKIFFNLITVKEKAPDTVGKSAEYKSKIPIFLSWNGLKAIMARKSDNITTLALQSDVDRDDFLRYNDMRVYDLVVEGQVYYLEKKRRKAKVPYHTVRPGETVWEIAQNYGIRQEKLLEKNRMEKPELLTPGRVMWLRRTRPKDEPIEYKPVPQPIFRSNTPKTEIVSTNPAIPSTPNRATRPLVDVRPPATDSVTKSIPATSPAPRPEKPLEVKPAEPKPAVAKPTEAKAAEEEDEDDEEEGKLVTIEEEDDEEETPAVENPSAKPKKETPSEGEKEEKKSASVAAPKVDTAKNNTLLGPNPALEGDTNYIKHVLEPAQTLFAVSFKYNVLLDSLKRWNKINDNTSLKPGMALYIKKRVQYKAPPIISGDLETVRKELKAQAEQQKKKDTPAKEKPKEVAKPLAKQAPSLEEPSVDTAGRVKQENTNPSEGIETKTHTVQAGETLFRIAKQYGLTVKEILEANGKSQPNINVGEKLKIPAKTNKP